MDRLRNGIRIQTQEGTPIQIGDVRLMPQAQSIQVRLPFGHLVYNHPVAVLAERNGAIERIPVVDVTRMVQLALFGFSFVYILLSFWLRMVRSAR
jgi:hypothetical protein